MRIFILAMLLSTSAMATFLGPFERTMTVCQRDEYMVAFTFGNFLPGLVSEKVHPEYLVKDYVVDLMKTTASETSYDLMLEDGRTFKLLTFNPPKEWDQIGSAYGAFDDPEAEDLDCEVFKK